MATKRYSEKTGEVPSRNDDNRLRRSAPADVGPPSPEKLKRLYDEGRTRLTKKQWLAPDHQANQDVEDFHDKAKAPGFNGYDNDVPEKSWLRGGGEGHRPNMDVGKFDISNKPDRVAPGGGRNKASGQDMHKSPFSAAHRKGAGEGF